MVWNQTGWAEAMIDLLIEMKRAAEDARAGHKRRLSAKVLVILESLRQDREGGTFRQP